MDSSPDRRNKAVFQISHSTVVDGASSLPRGMDVNMGRSHRPSLEVKLVKKNKKRKRKFHWTSHQTA